MHQSLEFLSVPRTVLGFGDMKVKKMCFLSHEFTVGGNTPKNDHCDSIPLASALIGMGVGCCAYAGDGWGPGSRSGGNPCLERCRVLS